MFLDNIEMNDFVKKEGEMNWQNLFYVIIL